ncbi:MAG: hypothetical protein P4M00_04560 [Azospirillaceae bacterium]|nr:hypothetical protein [Azospirillaceae bacterium]
MDDRYGQSGHRNRDGVAMFAALLAVAVTGSAPGAAYAARPTPGLGMNLYALTSSSTEIPFVDVFKMSSPWIIRHDDDPRYKGVPKLTADGWIAALDPHEYGLAQIFNGGDGHYPAGIYTVRYEGRGTLDFHWRGTELVSQKPGEIQIKVTPVTGGGDGIAIKELSTDPADPLRNIRVILPGYEAGPSTPLFYPPFLKALAPFRVLRMMAWNRTNRTDVVEWRDRRLPTYATQASELGNAQQSTTGVAYEYQIDLANALGADPWVNVPVKASDDFIQQMAQLFHQRLHADLHPHIEFSNEVWNTHFSDGTYAQNQGMAAGLAADRTAAGTIWYVRRASRMFDIWNQVYGADAAKIVHILAGVEMWPRLDDPLLSTEGVFHKTDALAVGGYFAPAEINAKTYAQFIDAAPDQILPLLREDVTVRVKGWLAQHQAAARKYGVSLVVYEGGPGLETSTAPREIRDPITAAFVAVNRDPRLAGLYRDFLDAFFQQGGTLFVHFNDVFAPSVFGNFGALEYQDQDPETAPKYRMLRDYVQAHAADFKR